MAQLTTFSKTLIVITLVGAIAIFAITCNSCLNGCSRQSNQNTGYYPTQQSQPQVMVVTQPDGSQVFWNYMLWKSLMDNGGQTTVNNYYNQHRTDEDFQPSNQSKYRDAYVQEEQVKTQKSNGFGSKPVETNKSNGFGSKPVETKKSNGFGTHVPDNPFNKSNYKPTTSSSSSSTSTKSVNTTKSSGFGTKSNSTSTTKSSGFGKKKN